MIAREACYYERWMTNSGINFANFNDQEIILKTFRKVLKLCSCRVYVIYWRFSAKWWWGCTFHKIVSYEKILLPLSRKNLKVQVVSGNATRLKENLLKLNSNLESTSRISIKYDLAVALKYSREHSLQNNVILLNRAAHIRNEIFEKHWHFTSSPTDIWQNKSVSAFLRSLIQMITCSSDDSNSKNKLAENTHTTTLSLSQLIHFNTVC